MAPMVKTPAALAMAPLVPRPPVELGLGELLKLERRELAELIAEETEESEEESSELIDETSDAIESVGNGEGVTEGVVDGEDGTGVVRNEEDTEGDTEDDKPLIAEVGGEDDVMEGREGMEVGLFKQTWEPLWPTTITGVALPTPLESPRTITTLVPGAIVT